ncbi:PspC domain protein [compost metagenome]
MTRLYRSRRDRWISGLIGGLGEYFGISSTALRILTLISIPFTGGTTLFIYFIAALVISKEPYQPYDPYFNGGWQGGGYQGGGMNGGSGYGYGGGQPGPQQGPQAYNEKPGSGGFSYNTSFSQRGSSPRQEEPSNLDSMMKDIEKKAMKKELEELRQKLAKYEKGEV